MQLQGRLRRTTLGDLLGTLYRARAHGTLELTEVSGPNAGRAHRIHLASGQVVALDAEEGGPPVGVILRGAGGLDAVLEQQLLDRLEPLFQIPDALVAFRVARPHPRPDARTLSVADYLHGRPRARDREGQGPRSGVPRAGSTPRSRALGLLGLPLDAGGEEIRRAFRRLAREVHPDRFPDAGALEQQRLLEKLSALTEAYHLLMR